MPTRIRRFPDLTVQAAMISLPTSWTNSSSSAPAAIRMRPARLTVHSALAAGFAPDGLLSAQLRCSLLKTTVPVESAGARNTCRSSFSASNRR
jgi:hypothetical protein